ncbi:response regulator [Thioalkalivibrio sp.]|uniref:response regulator transcription factor n=1 Tax=Thioalkalivibrio sp. TaxID=2093813 RepID=UPI0012D61137|nr:response regulator [Thioalkalivibrio sp.]TVP78795.1 MAG: DNA-binding response regulator [Thioalkalivibrio sp.]
MPAPRLPQVYLVDDDADVRTAVSLLLKTEDFRVTAFADASSVLAAVDDTTPGCLLLDVRLPDMDGLTLHRQLKARSVGMPVIFITGHGDIPMAVRAVNEGALDFLEKPFHDDALIEGVRHALALDAEQRAEAADMAEVEERLASLTPRERQVLEALLDGQPNKLIARHLDVSVRTVEIHRGHLMQKMGAKSASHLARLALACAGYRDRLVPH